MNDVKAADEIVSEQMQVPDNAVVMFTPKGKTESLAYTVEKGKKGLVIKLNGNRVKNHNVIKEIASRYHLGQSIKQEKAYEAAHNQLEDLKHQIHKENGFDYEPQYIGDKAPQKGTNIAAKLALESQVKAAQ